MDIFGNALLDYQSGDYIEDIISFSSLDEKDTMPLPYLFRGYDEMPVLEQKALQLAKGMVLDVGCGAGSHSLWLQENGFDVTALDRSSGAIEVCKRRGVLKTIQSSILDFSNKKFDTLLLLMNGIGIVGKLKNLCDHLTHFKGLLSDDGQILLDSSNIIYMFDQDDDGGHWVPGHLDYYGEVQFQLAYKKQKGPIFDWVYIDFNTLKKYAEQVGLRCELIVEGKHYDYLARLVID